MRIHISTAWCVLLMMYSQHGVACEQVAGKLVAFEGHVEVSTQGKLPWQAAHVSQMLCVTDVIAVRAHGRATLALNNDVLLRLDQNSTLTLSQVSTTQPSELTLGAGIVHVLTRFSKHFTVITPFINALVEGTEFTVQATADEGRVTVAEGHVRAFNSQGEQRLGAGMAAQAEQTAVPTTVQVTRPLEAMQWALYYPQITRFTAADRAVLPAPLSEQIEAAQSDVRRGQVEPALAVLAAMQKADLPVDSQYKYTAWCANVLLGVGRVEEAQHLLSDIKTDHVDVTALHTLIAVVLNQSQAPQVLEQTHSASAQLATSYVLQAQNDIQGAVHAAQQATQLEPDNSLAWLRLAELQLSDGQLVAGKTSVQRAVQLNPTVPRAQTLLGFAQLLNGDAQAAVQQFTAAQQLAPTDPQAHFGLGVALIRTQQLAPGRREIELAVVLDPGNAEWRSYLARAYQAEARDHFAEQSLELAKRLDPNSPTPWYFAAVRQQQLHRPLAAIENLQQALARNDNRAVYRPRALLDQDYATRSASLAQAFQTLRFEQLALNTAASALQQDPHNPAAYRQLAQAYELRPYQETARVSTLLQAQLRQPVGVLSLSPQSLATNVPILAGPQALSLQEVTPLFEQRIPHINAAVLAGENTTSAVALQTVLPLEGQALSFGHYHYQTDGFRDAADLGLNVTQFLWQWQFDNATQLQAEVRRTDSTSGDVRQRLLESTADPHFPQNDRYTQLARIGVHYAADPNTEWLFSAVKGREEDKKIQANFIEFPFGTASFISDAELQNNFYSMEAQWLQQFTHLNVQVGVGQYDEHVQGTTVLTSNNFDFSTFPPAPTTEFQQSQSDNKGRYNNLYTYVTTQIGPYLNILTGVSYDNFKNDQNNQFKSFRGKVGLNIQPLTGHSIRLAWYQGIKAQQAKEQTLAPVQFNGFTQLYDDVVGTRYYRTAMAYDAVLNTQTNAGMELGRRVLRIPNIGCEGICEGRWREQVARGYFSWRSHQGFVATFEPEYEQIKLLGAIDSWSYPIRTTTEQYPLRVSWLPTAQWRFDVEGRYVQQQVTLKPFGAVAVNANGQFWVTNLGAHYQLRQIVGISLFANNVFNKNIHFQNTDYGDDPKVPLFQPGRTLSLRANIYW